MKKIVIIALMGLLALLTGCQEPPIEREFMWNLTTLYDQAPDYWDVGLNYSTNVKAIQYRGQVYNEQETSIFAYIGIPTTEMPEGGYPAIILVHGGLGKAYPDWVKMWTDRGYVAIAPDFDAQMSTPQTGISTTIFNPDGGPKGYGVNADNLIGEKESSWTYQSVSNIIIAHNLLNSLEVVNTDKVGITGISWGSYLTSIVLGIDHRFSFAMPVYGAAYLDEDYGSILYSMFAGMSDDMLVIYRKYFDPSAYLQECTTPTFWMQGVKDYAFSPVQKQKALNTITKADVYYAYYEQMTHGQEQGASPEELLVFSNHIVNNEENIITLTPLTVEDSTMSIASNNGVGISSAYLFWTNSEDYEMHLATWYRSEVTIDGYEISATIPEGATYAFIEIDDALGNKVSSKFYEIKS